MRSRIWIVLALVALVVAACGGGGEAVTPGEALRGTDADPPALDSGDDRGSTTDADGQTAPDDASETGSDDSAQDPDDQGSDPDDETTDPGPSADPDLLWTIVGVEWDDTLNVRSAPNATATVVGELAPWTTGLTMTGGVTGSPAQWRELSLEDGTTGWINSRFVVAQPEALSTADESALTEAAQEFLAWVAGGDDLAPSTFLAERSLWVAGIGIYADAGSEWNWIPSAELTTTAGWATTRDFVVGQGIECGSECSLSLREFLNLDRIDDTTRILIDDIPGANEAHLEGKLWEAPSTLHRVVLDTPTSDPDQFFDWQRLHLIPDWSTGSAGFMAIHNHGWTP